MTPLYIAAYQGHAGCVRLLLAGGAKPTQNKDIKTALNLARML